MKSKIWIMYDLGIRGDYEGIYKWLDEHHAIECGDSIAFLQYEFSEDLIESFKKEIKASIDVTKKTRIYMIWRDTETKKTKGRFILGSRKAPPWRGFSSSGEELDDEEI